MVKLLSFFIFLILQLEFCTPPQQLISNLQLKNNKYYEKSNGKLFSGMAITKFDNSNVSTLTELKEGIPNGKWFVYGYKNEIIQEGFYVPILYFKQLNENKIGRLNVCFGKEGTYKFIDVYVIKEEKMINDSLNLKKTIEKFLKEKKIIGTSDRINELIFGNGELD